MAKAGAAAPPLFLACASGQHLKQAILSGRRAGGKDQMEFLKVTMSDILVSSYAAAGIDPDGPPQEQITLNFSKIDFALGQQRPDGSVGGTISAGWDLKANKKV